MIENTEYEVIYALDLSYQRQPKWPTSYRIMTRTAAQKYGKLISLLAIASWTGAHLLLATHYA